LAGRLVDIPFSEMVLLKITILLAVAWALHRALARANPRWRVLLWRVTAVAVVLGPLWMRFGPPVTVSIAEQPKAVANASPSASIARLSSLPSRSVSRPRLSGLAGAMQRISKAGASRL
jgi:hypothetical protein